MSKTEQNENKPVAEGAVEGDARLENKLKVATCSLAGCFGCHMSFLDMDEKIIDLIDFITLDRSPLTDIKKVSDCDIGLIEGGLCNEENIATLKSFRKACKVLVAVGACAINGGIPAFRNQFTLKECFEESYINGAGVVDPQIPNDPDLPPLLKKVHPIHELVTVDYFLPGCPPPSNAFIEILYALLEKREPHLDYEYRHFD